MKFTAHIPVEQYGYVEVEIEGDAIDAVQVYNEVKSAYTTGNGLAPKEFNRFIDHFMCHGKPPEDGMDLWQNMNEKQKNTVNEVKKAIKRLATSNQATNEN